MIPDNIRSITLNRVFSFTTWDSVEQKYVGKAARVQIVIDLDKVFAEAGVRAVKNRTGRATIRRGMIKAKLV